MHMSVTGTHGMAERRTGFAEDDGEWGVRRSERWKEDGREGPRPTETHEASLTTAVKRYADGFRPSA
jgi:hypothetical protein